MPEKSLQCLCTACVCLEDANECIHGTHKCYRYGAECLNTIGSYTCRCKKGFRGDGYTCRGKIVKALFITPSQNEISRGKSSVVTEAICKIHILTAIMDISIV
jgi:hypothetical protein